MNLSIMHTHSYTDHYEQSTDSSHEAYCWCGEYEIQDHSYDGYAITDSHHSKACACGATDASEEHFGYKHIKESDHTHYVYCECGYLMGSEVHHMVRQGTLLLNTCVYCGYVRVPGSGNVIMGEEDEIETPTE